MYSNTLLQNPDIEKCLKDAQDAIARSFTIPSIYFSTNQSIHEEFYKKYMESSVGLLRKNNLFKYIEIGDAFIPVQGRMGKWNKQFCKWDYVLIDANGVESLCTQKTFLSRRALRIYHKKKLWRNMAFFNIEFSPVGIVNTVILK